jgi:hypothetical protein
MKIAMMMWNGEDVEQVATYWTGQDGVVLTADTRGLEPSVRDPEDMATYSPSDGDRYLVAMLHKYDSVPYCYARVVEGTDVLRSVDPPGTEREEYPRPREGLPRSTDH